MIRNTLSLRLLTTSSIWVVLTLIAAGALLLVLFRGHLERRFEAFLFDQLKGNIAASEISSEDGALRMTWSPSNLRFHRPLSGWYWQILENGGVVAKSRSLWLDELTVTDPGIGAGLQRQHLVGPSGKSLLALVQDITLPNSDAIFTFVVTGPVSNIDHDVNQFAGMLLMTLATLGIGLLGAIFLQIRYGLRPLRRLKHALAEIRSGNAKRLSENFPSEIQPAVSELNALLDHNATLLDRARTQTANLAHALKNPLTVLKNEAREIPGELRRLMCDRVTDMTHSVNRYLSRARAAGAGHRLASPVSVKAVAEDLRFSIDHLYKDKCLQLHLSGLDDVNFQGDAQDLEEMLGNLMDNACKWAQTTVHVWGERSGDHLRVVVEDDGPGIPEGQEAFVLQRGRRLDETIPGSGLGLDIVRDIVMLYGGSLHLSHSALGGLRATLEWPTPDKTRVS